MPAEAPSARILVVDDDTTSRLLVAALLAKEGHVVSSLESGEEARTALTQNGCDAFDAVVTDFWMPGCTGLELLQFVHAADATLATVLVTAAGEKELVANALREGASGYLDKPIQPAQLRETVATAIASTRRQRALRASAQAVRNVGLSQLRLLEQHTAALAHRIQYFYQPHSEAGGDFITALPLSAGRFIVLASDVSGHDLNAAYQSIYFHGMAHGMMRRQAGLSEVFREFNDLLLQNWIRFGSVDVSLAAFGAYVDIDGGRMEVLNCGFPVPLLADADGWCFPLTVSACPLGWFEELPAGQLNGLTGHFLHFWSDGLVELAVRLGLDPCSLAHRLLQTRDDNFSLLSHADDDILAVRTCLTREVTPAAVPLLRQVYPGSKYGEIDAIQAFCDRSLRIAVPDLAEARLANALLCLREGLLNALLHGCRRAADQFATLEVAYAPDSRQLRVRISDTGCGHDFDAAAHETAAAQQLLAQHRGLVLMRNLPAATRFENRGATVTMDFSL